jgi:ribosomal protein S18
MQIALSCNFGIKLSNRSRSCIAGIGKGNFTGFLLKFINDQGKILPRRLTGTSLKYQRKVAQAVKRARHIGVLPYVADSLK